MTTIWQDGIYGLVVGDALGVPVEFTSREERRREPVAGMLAYGTHNQPAGTWSDDSSMALATLDSIAEKNGIDYRDIMERFGRWCLYNDYTPFGEMFDIGNATAHAIGKYGRGEEPLESGGKEDWDNGNGSLMRILPVCLWVYEQQKNGCMPEEECVTIVHNASALTHAHLRSQISCGLYFFLVKAVLEKESNFIERLQSGIDAGFRYYRKNENNREELEHFRRLEDLFSFKEQNDDVIKSSGYVVDTLEASIWSLITTNSYKTAVLKAVNLGDDTDTVGAVTGGLAGLYYGMDSIPKDWIKTIKTKEMIDEILGKIL